MILIVKVWMMILRRRGRRRRPLRRRIIQTFTNGDQSDLGRAVVGVVVLVSARNAWMLGAAGRDWRSFSRFRRRRVSLFVRLCVSGV